MLKHKPSSHKEANEAIHNSAFRVVSGWPRWDTGCRRRQLVRECGTLASGKRLSELICWSKGGNRFNSNYGHPLQSGIN